MGELAARSTTVSDDGETDAPSQTRFNRTVDQRESAMHIVRDSLRFLFFAPIMLVKIFFGLFLP